jgi:hypothetical protein
VRVGKDGCWDAPLFDGIEMELVAFQDGVAVLTSAMNIPGLGLATSTTRIALPRGAEQVRVAKNPARLCYKLVLPRTEGATEAKVEFEFEAKPQIMSSLAKVLGNKKFGNLWTARAVFKSTGTQTLKDYRVRFRFTEHTAAWSPWSGTSVVVPGQTVVDPYFPILDQEKVGKMTGSTRAAVEVQYQYKTADGKLVEESDTREVMILSRNQVYMSTLPANAWVDYEDQTNLARAVLSAFVTHEDPVIQQAAGWISKQAGGAASSLSDKDAEKFMRCAFDFMSANITYQTPPFGETETKHVQHIKYGRDVLRNRAGTCIDLAILYGSLCEAVGLQPVLYMIPGHCFPAVIMPESGKVVPVEATMIGRKFEDAVKYGYEKHFKGFDEGRISFNRVNIAQMRKLGVTPLDLPDLMGDSLEKWGIKQVAANANEHAEQGGNENRPQPQPQPPINNLIVGNWSAILASNGIRVVQAVSINANGTFATAIEASTGYKTSFYGTWTLTGNKFVFKPTNGPNAGVTEVGVVEWIDANNLRYTGPSGVAMVYQRY